jgi:antitoxin ParD1/3/4
VAALCGEYDILIRMNTMERITITITPEMAQALRGAVEAGEYASSSEIIREALRDWRHKRALQEQELADLRAKIEEGLADIDAGRVRDFDAERIIRKGEERLHKRDASA